MKTWKKWRTMTLAACLLFAVALVITACGADAAISVDANGKYSYQEIEGAARYVIEIYRSDDVDLESGTIHDEAKYVIRKSFSPSMKRSGSSTSFAAVPFGKYVPVVYGIHSDRKTTTDMFFGEEYTVGGTLSRPEVMVTNKGLGAVVRIKQNSMKTYTTNEAIYSFTTEVYSDSECKNLVTEVTFGEKAEAANNSFYRFHTGEFTVDKAGIYYVRTKANGKQEDLVEDSQWGDVVEIELQENVDDTYSIDMTLSKEADGYDFSDVSLDFVYDLMWHKEFGNVQMNEAGDGEFLKFTCTSTGMMAETTVFHLLEDGTLYIDGPSQIPVDLSCYTGTWSETADGSLEIHADTTDYNTVSEDELSEGSGVKGAIEISAGWGAGPGGGPGPGPQ